MGFPFLIGYLSTIEINDRQVYTDLDKTDNFIMEN